MYFIKTNLENWLHISTESKRRFQWYYFFKFRGRIRKLQSWPKYMRHTWVLVWKSTLQVKVQFQFLNSFLLVLTKFLFLEEDWALGYNSMKIWDLLNISQFPKILRFLSLKLFCNSWGNSYVPCLLLIITICFTCGERKIW